MIVTLLMTLEGSSPEISRCVNVDDSLDLGQLAEVIDAAFGFSGAASHVFAMGSGTVRQVFSESPGAGESGESDVRVSAVSEITYIYDPTANWNIRVESLGPSELGGPTPLLVDAAGPDIVESANGPELMTRFRHEARRIAAGLPPNMEVTPLLLSFLPVMSPERMLDRLTIADPVTVATRVSYIAEELFYDPIDQQPGPHAPSLVDDFEDFLDSRPDLRAIFHDDPHPDQNPTLLAAVADFFDQRPRDPLDTDDLDDNVIMFPGAAARERTGSTEGTGATGDEVDVFTDRLHRALGFFLEPVALTETGELPSASVNEMLEAMGIEQRYPEPEESWIPAVHLTRKLLEGGGFIEVRDGHVGVTEFGRTNYEFFDTGLNIEEWAAGYERAFGEEVWKAVLWVFADWFGFGSSYGITAPPDQDVPDDLHDVLRYFNDLGGLDPSDRDEPWSWSVRRMLGRILAYYVHGY